MRDFLAGTDQRMLLGYCSDSILNRQGRNTEIEGWFEENTLDALFYDLLLFIMNASLTYRDGTTMHEIRSFLQEDLEMYQVKLEPAQIDRLSEYMIKDILQNGGKTNYYRVFDTSSLKWISKPVRLIEDTIHEDEIYYHLSEQGYDFLLRTKEIDAQYDGWVSMMIMQQKLKHGNFKDSKDQCRQCLNILRREQAQFDAFVARVRQDVNSIGNEEYSKMISSYYENLEDEKKLTDEVITLVDQYRSQMSQEQQHAFRGGDEIRKNLEYLKEMAQMLAMISGDEEKLLSKRYTVRDLYSQMLDENLTLTVQDRYNFNDTVIRPSASLSGNVQAAGYMHLLDPLSEPEVRKVFDLHLLYQPEKKITQEDDSDIVLTMEDDEEAGREKEEAQKWSACYAETIDGLLRYGLAHKDGFAARDFIQWYEYEDGHVILQEQDDKSFYLIFLALFAQGTIVLHVSKDYKNTPSRDFDIEGALAVISQQHPDFYGIHALQVWSEEGEDFYRMDDSETDAYQMELGMSRIWIRCVMEEGK